MKKELNAEVELIEGAGGVFDVHVDGRLVFSKHKVGRHAAPGEVLGAIRAQAG